MTIQPAKGNTMNGCAQEGQIGGYAPQRFSGDGREALLLGATKAAPAVHSAQEGLDKAISCLYSELDQLESRLQPVLTQVPEKVGDNVGANNAAYSVATKIGASAEVIAALAGRVRRLTGRLEV
jgi:hypothetical protein